MRLPVDRRVKEFIRQQVTDGVYSVSEMQRHTEGFVRHQLFDGKPLPPRLCRRYYPTKRDIINIMYSTRTARLHSKIDQENLQHKILQWQADNPCDSFFFRPYVRSEEIDSARADIDGDDDVVLRGRDGLLIVYQSSWQKRLLVKYGSLCLMDATYKTCRYAVPLFFLCVKTNVDYVVVGTFVTQFEDSSSIAEALSILRAWNDNWVPQSFMVDFSEAEINALETLFPGKIETDTQSYLVAPLSSTADIQTHFGSIHLATPCQRQRKGSTKSFCMHSSDGM